MTVSAGGVELPADVAQRFRASTVLHAGTTSVLFQGTDPATGRPVVVKVLRDAAIPSAAERQRMLRELQKLTQVRHAALVPILAAGESNGAIWLAREQVDAAPVSDRLAAEGPFTPARVARIAAQVAAALGELHRNGVLHRDVRPGHVLVDGAGQVRVLDAAVARTTRLPDGRMLSGTPGYVAPEAIAGKLVSFRSDLYSLGALVFELLHGAPPYGLPDTPNVLQFQTDRDAPPARMGTPPAMATLIASLLSREPRERPFSAQQLERQLEPLAAAEANDGGDESAATMATSMEELAQAANEDATTVVPPMSEISKSRAAPPPQAALDDPPTQISDRSSPGTPAPRPGAGMPPRPAAGAPAARPAAGAPTAGPPRKATMIGMAPLGPSAPTAPIPGGALAVAAVPEISPMQRPTEGSGQRPAPINANEFDDAVDTVVTEDSRIFGVPEVSGGSPHGSAVPPLPDAVAARVLTGSVKPGPAMGSPMGRGPATASMPAAPSPQMQMQMQMGGPPGGPPMPAGAFGMPGPGAGAMAPPQQQAGWNAPGPPNQGGWQQNASASSQPGQPGWGPNASPPGWNQPQPNQAPAWNAPTAPQMQPMVAPQGQQYGQAPLGPPPQVPNAFAAPNAYPNAPTAPFPGQQPQAFGPPGYPQQPQYPGAAYPGYAQPTAKRSILPWILAGIGVAGIAGASGYFFASRDRAPTQSVTTANNGPVPIAPTPTTATGAGTNTAVPGTTPTAVAPTANPQGANVAAPNPANPNRVAPPPSGVAVQPVPNAGQPPTRVPATPPLAPVMAPPPVVQNVAANPPPVAPAPTEDHSSHSRHHHGSDSDANNAAPAPTRASSYAQARAAYDHHDYTQARTLANAAVREQPNNAEAHALLAEILGRGNDANGAFNEWRAASRAAPRNTDYLHRIANIQLDRFDRTGATATLRQILQIAPNDTAAQRQLQSLGGGGAAPANNNARPANNATPQPANNNTARPTNTTTNTTARPTQGTAPAANTTRPTTTTTRRTGGSDPFVPTFGAPAPARGTGRAGSIRR